MKQKYRHGRLPAIHRDKSCKSKETAFGIILLSVVKANLLQVKPCFKPMV